MIDQDLLRAQIIKLWTAPTPADLWKLQAPLLALDTSEALAAHRVAGQFYGYLSLLETKLTSQRYSQFAAMLATGAVVTVGIQDVLEDVFAGKPVNLSEVFGAGLAGALEVMSAIQHVKAWETDTCTADCEAAWNLYEALWQLSVRLQPDLTHTGRAEHLERVLAPLAADETPSPVRAALIIRLFQVVLLLNLLPLFLPG
jgi:hypothetical protein